MNPNIWIPIIIGFLFYLAIRFDAVSDRVRTLEKCINAEREAGTT